MRVSNRLWYSVFSEHFIYLESITIGDSMSSAECSSRPILYSIYVNHLPSVLNSLINKVTVIYVLFYCLITFHCVVELLTTDEFCTWRQPRHTGTCYSVTRWCVHDIGVHIAHHPELVLLSFFNINYYIRNNLTNSW